MVNSVLAHLKFKKFDIGVYGMKKVFCLLLLSFVLLQVAVANAESDGEAEKTLKTSVNGVLEVLSNEEMPM